MTKPFWTNSLPLGWQADQLRHVAEIANSNVDKKSYDDGTPVRLCNYTDVYYNEYITNDMELMEATATPSEIRRFLLRPGDVIITKDSESWDDIAVPTCVNEPLDNVVCGYHLTLMRTKPNRMIGRFLLRALQAEGVREQFWLAANGVTRFGLGQQGMKSALLPVPPLSTQQAIANFLDEKTAAIDDLIAKKERLIELLEEKRAALINRAVTKGLDPDVPMKDSGIPWIGEIPEHWENRRLKTVSTFVTSGPRGWGQYYSESGPVFLRIGNVDRKRIDLLLQEADIQNVAPPRNAEGVRTRVQADDLLITITADIGSVGIVPRDLGEAYVNQHISLVRPKRHVPSPRYLAYSAWSDVGRVHFQQSMQGGTKLGLNLDDVRNMPLMWAPREEQVQISTFLDTHCSKIDYASGMLGQQLTILREYRQSLITAAVTGQLDFEAAGGEVA